MSLITTANQILATVSRAQLPDLWEKAVSTVWGPNVKTVVTISDEAPKGGVLASLSYAGKPTAIGRRLIVYPKTATLRVNDQLFTKNPDVITGILMHEAIHLGYPRHDSDFKKVAQEVGAPLTEAAADNKKVRIQVKDGSRYKDYKEFDTEEEARTWYKTEGKEELKGKQVRMAM